MTKRVAAGPAKRFFSGTALMSCLLVLCAGVIVAAKAWPDVSARFSAAMPSVGTFTNAATAQTAAPAPDTQDQAPAAAPPTAQELAAQQEAERRAKRRAEAGDALRTVRSLLETRADQSSGL
ncbi:MAG: hypothetical protein AAFO79_09390, partial [Pseudomonadota bacterium]